MYYAKSLFQSFNLPPLKVKPEHVSNIEPQEGPFGVPNPLVAGLAATKNKLGMSHPLEVSERSVSKFIPTFAYEWLDTKYIRKQKETLSSNN